MVVGLPCAQERDGYHRSVLVDAGLAENIGTKVTKRNACGLQVLCFTRKILRFLLVLKRIFQRRCTQKPRAELFDEANGAIQLV